MAKEVLSALELLWSAEEFNRHTDKVITLPMTASMYKSQIAKSNKDLNLENVESTLLYENISVKDYAISSVKRCFTQGKQSDNVIKKRKVIETGLAQYFS
jgi:hypothetical protein